jgi:thioredoxin reductase (NADPH)
VIDCRYYGGQAGASARIENNLGFPTGISGSALAGRADVQALKFGAKIAVARGAVKMQCHDGLVAIGLAGGETVLTRAVVLATGAEYRKLNVPELHRFEGVGVYYAATFMEAQRCTKDEIIVVGGGNSAGQAATYLSQSSAHVHMLIRGEGLAASMSRYLIRRIEETPNITLHRRTQIVAFHGNDQLEAVTWRDATSESRHEIRHVFTMAGASPNTAWLRDNLALDDHGFIRTDLELTDEILRERHWPLKRRPHLFETSHPHVFAFGDVRANNVKRVASAVGEGSVCIQLVHKTLTE